MTSRLAVVGLALLMACPVVVSLLYAPSGLSPEDSFTSTYEALVMVETLALLSVLVLLVPLVARALSSQLARQVRLGRGAKAVAAIVMVAGLFLFIYWAAVDVLSGYQSFPDYAFEKYPVTANIYHALGLGLIPDGHHLIGVIGFAAAIAGLTVLRLGRGIGPAIKDAAAYFAAPLVIFFELAIWASAPAELYWHATDFAPWSLGRLINADQFEIIYNSHEFFVWGGNLYAVSNWFALAAACGVLGVAVALAMQRRSEGAEAELVEPASSIRT